MSYYGIISDGSFQDPGKDREYYNAEISYAIYETPGIVTFEQLTECPLIYHACRHSVGTGLFDMSPTFTEVAAVLAAMMYLVDHNMVTHETRIQYFVDCEALPQLIRSMMLDARYAWSVQTAAAHKWLASLRKTLGFRWLSATEFTVISGDVMKKSIIGH